MPFYLSAGNAGSKAATVADPAALARQLHDAAAELAGCLAEDVQIEPTQVFVPLLRTMNRLQEISGALGRAAISVDEQAGRAAHRAADQFAGAYRELAEAAIRLRGAERPPPPPSSRPRRRRPAR